jgi:Ni/Co efflux regulator RcnB
MPVSENILAMKRFCSLLLLLALMAGAGTLSAQPGWERMPPEDRREMRQQMRDHWQQPAHQAKEGRRYERFDGDRMDDREDRRRWRQDLRQEMRDQDRRQRQWDDDSGHRRQRGRD